MLRLRNGYTTRLYSTLNNYEFIKSENVILRNTFISPFRNEDGSLIKGKNSKEARLTDKTLEGKANHEISILPEPISKVIQDHILPEHQPTRLREKIQKIYLELGKNQIQIAPTTSLEVNARIGGLFLQDYSHVKQVLGELKDRKENFSPQRVLSIGYGPATGIIALNELMKDEKWTPVEKEAYIIGRKNYEMKKKAKVILSRQESESKDVEKGKLVDHKELTIETKLRDNLPTNKQYDLIILEHSLLSKEYKFPKDIDENIRMVLKLLSPGGNLTLIERGNSVGFESIARARQIMIRPESHPTEIGKIPRPYLRGSRIKPQRRPFKDDDLIIDENLQQELNEKFGELTEDEIKFDEEDDFENYEVMEIPQEEEQEQEQELMDYHLSVIAPCPHHRKCPLQLGDPKYYKIPSHKHRLNFCSFTKNVERPKYTIELKKGLTLASKWDKGGESLTGNLDRKEKKIYEGKGRPGGKNYETGSYSYLIVERSANDKETIEKINQARKFNNFDHKDFIKDRTYWPRIIETPNKGKSLVQFSVCSNEGNVEMFKIPKSMGKEVYHDARKAQIGDLWPNGYKIRTVKNQLSDTNKEKLDYLYKTEKKTFKKEQKTKVWKKIQSQDINSFFDDETELMIRKFENSNKLTKQDRKETKYNDNNDKM
ncbi:unnamed protein product [Candida verbasci]|uniref:Uncharacterized protein n=1 Tax=Candida verbasci TaxID=1227364 RepID=A0A9W4XGH3_9ASCO|nr:unnamed protein product [Candida verbasci]